MGLPGGSIIETSFSQCRGHRFDSKSGTKILHATWHGQNKQRSYFLKKKIFFFTEAEVNIIVTKGWEKGCRGSISGRQWQFGDNEQVLEMGGADVCTAT